MTRRRFLGFTGLATASVGATMVWPQVSKGEGAPAQAEPAVDYLTPDDQFVNVGRGTPPPHELDADQRRKVGLVSETWQLEVVPDTETKAALERPLTQATGNALDWRGLMKLAETRAVAFLHVISCTNGDRPFGMGLWEGVPLRDVVWLARPTANVRRVVYYGYHNDDPKQRFQSSLTLDRVLEDPPGELPVLLCYKLNGQWLTPKRGGPVRLFAPGFYGNKSVKWVQRIILTNNPQATDTYATWNNDTESSLKTCAFFGPIASPAPAGRSIRISGLAQVGMSGLGRVQYCVLPQGTAWSMDDPDHGPADWRDADILPAPRSWGAGDPLAKSPLASVQFEAATGQPRHWPLRYTVVHWAASLSGLAPGKYDLRCRTIDANGIAQPMPRPLLKSGNNAIQKVSLEIRSQHVPAVGAGH